MPAEDMKGSFDEKYFVDADYNVQPLSKFVVKSSSDRRSEAGHKMADLNVKGKAKVNWL